MNKLHNFRFVGEFPMFDSADDGGSSFISNSKRNASLLNQDIYLSPIDTSKAYYDLTDNYADKTWFNLRYIEGHDVPKSGKMANELAVLNEIDVNNIDTAEFIFLDSFERDIQNAIPDINLEDIFLDPHIMNAGDRKGEKSNNSDFVFGYYLNENPMKERKAKYSSRNGKENKYKRRKNM
ncbi:unnamed protein product [Phyllotreta striolata]|uniref:Uncharacterized protein n=1 Tax=Phyllotreta striolata TaxID=444603 RepID=A0A9N9THU6_PHYSR|nr:unnamed protein product [Phyllotreta striolata]